LPSGVFLIFLLDKRRWLELQDEHVRARSRLRLAHDVVADEADLEGLFHGSPRRLADEPRCLAQDFAPRRPAGSSSSLECVVRRLLARRQLVRLEHGAQLLWDIVHVRANAEDGANDGARPVAEAYCHHVGVRVLDRASPDDVCHADRHLLFQGVLLPDLNIVGVHGEVHW